MRYPDRHVIIKFWIFGQLSFLYTSICLRKMRILQVRNQFLITSVKITNRPPEVFFIKTCSENMQQIDRRTPMLKCHFNKIALQLYWNRTLASSVNLLYIFRTTFYKNTSGGLLENWRHFLTLHVFTWMLQLYITSFGSDQE